MYTLTWTRDGNGWTATLRANGRRIGIGSLDDASAVQCIRDAAPVGLSLRDVVNAARKLAKRVAAAKALRMAAKLARNPMLQAIIPPQVALAIRATMAARSLVVRARRGDGAASAALARTRRNPRNARAFRAAARIFGERC